MRNKFVKAQRSRTLKLIRDLNLGTLARREVCEGLVYAEFPPSVTFRGVRVGKSLAPGCCKIPVKRCRCVKILGSEFAYSVVFTGKQDAAFLYFIQRCNIYIYIYIYLLNISWHFRQRSRRHLISSDYPGCLLLALSPTLGSNFRSRALGGNTEGVKTGKERADKAVSSSCANDRVPAESPVRDPYSTQRHHLILANRLNIHEDSLWSRT
ncbi:hypothetical protein ALC57_17549 [Trachymyrmex cornetzi]|uniref:Uncharacterized protein n=1 Tax=Trachymyrmex cornetzi TaxID=471704 RepID=A0A195DC03_9HYME|nr:hypothetical protein ALC57_17549 [Trachymyrmex cornetzi]